MLFLLLLTLTTLLFCQDSTILTDSASSQDSSSITDMIKGAVGQIISILLAVLIALFIKWLKKFDIFIELPNIKETASRACLNADHLLNITGDDKRALVKAELEQAFTAKQHNIINTVFKGVDGLIDHIFKKVVKPERLYKLIKSIGK